MGSPIFPPSTGGGGGTGTSDHSQLTNRTAANQHPASAIAPDTSQFNKNLSSADDTVQKALDTLDNLSASGGTWGSITGTLSAQTDLNTELTSRPKHFVQDAEPATAVTGDWWEDTDDLSVPFAQIDTDGTLAANSDAKIPSQKAVKAAIVSITPQLRMLYLPTYLYASNGTEKSIKITGGFNVQNSSANGDYMIIPIYCTGGESIVDLSSYKSSTRGIFDLYISNDGITYTLDSSGYDQYASTAADAFTSITLIRPIIRGWNFLKLVINGKNASSTGYYLSIYGVRIR